MKEEETITLPNGELMTFCRIPAGSFVMGSRDGFDNEQPEHRVVLTKDYWLGKTPVTQEQFAAWKEDHENGFSGEKGLPVEQVTWKEALDYCRWMVDLLERSPLAGLIGHLPTEAQWEYACRAGTDTDYHRGDGVAALAEVGWFDQNSGGKAHPVGSMPGNAWGLHDMHGNVVEWCLDCYDAEAYPKHAAEDPFVSGEMAPKEEDATTALLRVWAEQLEKILKEEAMDREVLEDLCQQAYQLSESSPSYKRWGDLDNAVRQALKHEPLSDEERDEISHWRRFFQAQVPKTDDPARVFRGGSWGGVARNCRAAFRNRWAPGIRNWSRGFRVCLVSGPAFQP